MSWLGSYTAFVRLAVKHATGGSEAGADEFFRLGMDAYYASDFEIAERALRRATHLAPKRADFHSTLGNVAYDRGKLDEAQTSFASALDIDGDAPDALFGMAATLHAGNMESDAIYYYLSYLRRRPDSAVAMVNLGSAFQATGQIQEAIDMFERACQVQPDDPYILGMYGRSLYELGRLEEAIPKLRRAVERGSTDSEVMRALSLSLTAEDEVEDARQQLERALDADPENVAARIDLSGLLTDRGELEGALEHAEKAASIAKEKKRPTSERALALGQLGWAHYKLGNWREAAKASKKALDLAPDFQVVRFNLGLALLHASHVEEAKAEYERGVEDVDDALDLKIDAIEDLQQALAADPNLAGGREILAFLEAKHRELTEKHADVRAHERPVSPQPS